MKKTLHSLLLLSLFSGLLVSCSQQSTLVKQEEATTYKYKKVYVGNRIVYRENPTEITSKEISPITSATSLNNTSNVRKPVEIQAPVNIKEDVKTKKAKTSKSNKNWFNRTTHAGMRTAQDFWLQQNQLDDRGNKSSSTKATDSVRGILGIIGFILGLLGILGFIGASFAGIGIGAAILGIVFSVLGLKSEFSQLSYIGMVLSIIVLVLLIVL